MKSNPQITQINADFKKQVSRKGAKAHNNIEKKTYPCRVVGGSVAEDLFERGLCLPSGTAMTDVDLDRVAAIIKGISQGTNRVNRNRVTSRLKGTEEQGHIPVK